MFDYIEKLRRKPEAEKRRFVFGAALTVTLIVAAFWAVALGVKIRRDGLIPSPSVEEKSRMSERLSEMRQSWADFMDTVSDTFTESENAFTKPAESGDVEATSGLRMEDGFAD